MRLFADIGESSEDTFIPVPNVSGPVLTKVFEFCEHHRADDPDRKTVDDWDTEFLAAVNEDMLLHLIMVRREKRSARTEKAKKRIARSVARGAKN